MWNMQCTLQNCSLVHISLWPLTFQLGQRFSEGQCWDCSFTILPALPQHVGHCLFCVALFSPPSCVAEKQWCHSAVRPCCHSVKAAPFDFDWTALSFVLWRWPKWVLRGVLQEQKGGILHSPNTDAQWSPLFHTTRTVSALLFQCLLTRVIGYCCDSRSFSLTFWTSFFFQVKVEKECEWIRYIWHVLKTQAGSREARLQD